MRMFFAAAQNTMVRHSFCKLFNGILTKGHLDKRPLLWINMKFSHFVTCRLASSAQTIIHVALNVLLLFEIRMLLNVHHYSSYSVHNFVNFSFATCSFALPQFRDCEVRDKSRHSMSCTLLLKVPTKALKTKSNPAGCSAICTNWSANPVWPV